MTNVNQALSSNALMVKNGEVVFPDVLVHLPIFSPSNTGEYVRHVIPNLANFTDIVIIGKKLNVNFHKKAYSHVLSKAQQRNSTSVLIDLHEMFREFGYDNKDFSHYTNLFAELMESLFEMRVSYTSPSGVRFDGRLVNSKSIPKDGVATVDFGGIYQELHNSHPRFSRLNYLEDRIKGDIALVLKEKLDIEYRKLSGTNKKTIKVNAEYLLQSLQLSGERENQMKALNKVFKYFIDKNYIITIQKKSRSKKIYEFVITFNPNFKMEDFDDVITKGKIAKAKATKPLVAEFPAPVILNISDGVDLVEPEGMSDEEYRMDFDSIFTEPKALVKDTQSSSPEQAVDVVDADAWNTTCDFNSWVNESNKGN
ncbi:hypothetical protein [Pseudomonas fluorescens]|uniref:hypothetical protein n=1 Tax=Pseudomonas fluorescens TaxID=294 RepID=UPI00058A6805|nr:hypothetical protein [Pseudomonas fluorescens]CEL31184.1 hypothetical protein SRM1_04548 [Pseudomonas fluorescens]